MQRIDRSASITVRKSFRQRLTRLMNSSQILTRCLAVSSMRALERASGNKSIAVCKCWSHNGPRGGLRNRLVAGTGNFPTCPSVIWPALSREHRFNRCRSTARYYTSAHSFTSPRRSNATGAPMRASLLAINIPESYKGGGEGRGESAPPLIEFYPAFGYARFLWVFFIVIVSLVFVRVGINIIRRIIDPWIDVKLSEVEMIFRDWKIFVFFLHWISRNCFCFFFFFCIA